jgi:hypothetical protein
MDYLRLGLVNLLGVLAPGFLFSIGALLGIVGALDLTGLANYRDTMAAFERSQGPLSAVALLLSLVFGSVIRLFANDAAEVISGVYLRWLRRKHDSLARERFPYPLVARQIEMNVGLQVVQFLCKQNRAYTDEGNKEYYNYCKIYVRTHSPSRADVCERIEAYVRFLAGVLLAALFTAIVAAALAVWAWVAGRQGVALALAWSFVLLGLVIAGIAERFRYQHTREVFHTWVSYYDAFIEKEGRQAGCMNQGTAEGDCS